ncbi:MAG: pyridoxamine 5'-phosphate oxidase family protein [Anaerolineae bacterium]|nr:MAG: pyridoxamine 5'-phosphate oxidase family protein [Anaerolineae bacterium]
MWLASVRADGRPHLVPIWFVLHDAALPVHHTPQRENA